MENKNWTLEKVINTPIYSAQDVVCDDKTVARVFFHERNTIYPKENYANLIASAPDMYEALKYLVAKIHEHKPCPVCDGKGERPLLGDIHECEFCHGSKIDILTGMANKALRKADGK